MCLAVREGRHAGAGDTALVLVAFPPRAEGQACARACGREVNSVRHPCPAPPFGLFTEGLDC